MTPALFELLDQAIAESKPEDRPGLVVALAARLAQLGAGLLVPSVPRNSAEGPDDSLDVDEAARRTGMSVSWLYKNARRLPFAAKQGRRVVFSARGLERWRTRRMGQP